MTAPTKVVRVTNRVRRVATVCRKAAAVAVVVVVVAAVRAVVVTKLQRTKPLAESVLNI